MPIRTYFLVITPALLAFLWLAGWYMQPEPPKVYKTASTQAVKPAAPTTGAAPSTNTSSAPADATPAAPEIKLVASTPVEEAKPVVHQAAKPKKRKQMARRKPRDDQGSVYAYGTPAGGSPYGGQYAGYQPFFGYSRW